MNNFRKIIFVLVIVFIFFGVSNQAEAAVNVFNGTEDQLRSQYGAVIAQDMRDNGNVSIGNAGFYSNDNGHTLDRVCSLIDPNAVASYWRNDGYTSPGNNTIVLWNGSFWQKVPAQHYNLHLRYWLTCTVYNVPPPVVNYNAYCGDGIQNQTWEQCDGGSQCTSKCQDASINQCQDLVLARVNVTAVSNVVNPPTPTPGGGGNPGGGGWRDDDVMLHIFKNIVPTVYALPTNFWVGHNGAGGIGLYSNGGNLSSDIFVGNALNRIPEGTWFPLYFNGNYYNDADSTGYEDVPGLAVQRAEDSIKTVLHGGHTGVGKEHVEGNIEVWNASIVGQLNDTSGNNGYENPTDGIMETNPFQDEYWLSGGKSYFWSTVTAQDDGFYTNYSIAAPICVAAPAVNFDANPTVITDGDSSVITWSSTNTISCTGTNFTTGGATSGFVTVFPNSTTNYSISCSGPGGTTNDSKTITINAPNASAVTFAATLTTINQGDTTKLIWSSVNTTTCSSPQFGTFDATSGSIIVSPSSTKTYDLSCTGPSGTISDSLSIMVITPTGAPTCTLDASPRNIVVGNTTKLTWTSTNATSAVINNGVGMISLVSVGDVDITPAVTTTYTATFTGLGGSATCSEEVTVDSLSVCTNCGGGGGGPSFDPNISLSIHDNPGEQPLAFVHLSQIPYTGFGAGPVVTSLFWIIVLAISAFLGNLMVSRGVMDRFMAFMVQQGNDSTQKINMMNFSDTTTDGEEEEEEVKPTTPVNLSGTLEARAHEENILVSSEGLNIVIGLGGGTEYGAIEMLETLIERAKDTYPREDGWILLNTKRVHNLLPHTTVQNTPEEVEEEDEVQAPTEEDTTEKETMNQNDLIAEFIKNIILKDINKTFEILRQVKDLSPPEFIAQVVVTLDDVYKDRLEGYRNKNEEVSKLLSNWTDDLLEGVIEILAEAIDHSYKSNRIGVKVALTKMFNFLN